MTEDRDEGLEAFFAAARAAPPVPPDRLRASVLADASAARDGARGLVPVRRGRGVSGALAALSRLVGPAAWGGIAAAGIAGLSVGWLQSDRVAALGGALWQAEAAETLELFPSFEGMLEDGDG